MLRPGTPASSSIQCGVGMASRSNTRLLIALSIASALAMDKAMSKRVFEREAIPTPHWMLLEAGVPGRSIDTSLLGGYPLVVKPNAEGSTVGLSIVRHPSELDPAIEKAGRFDQQVMIERYIEGRELTVAVVGE